MAFRGAGIPGWILATTLVTAVVVAAVAVAFGLSPVLPAFCYLAAAGVPLAFIDARERRLPDVVTLPSYPASLLLLGVAAIFVPGGPGRFVHALIGMAVAVAFFGLLLLVSPAGIGLGEAGRAARGLPGLARRGRVRDGADGRVAARGGHRGRPAAHPPGHEEI